MTNNNPKITRGRAIPTADLKKVGVAQKRLNRAYARLLRKGIHGGWRKVAVDCGLSNVRYVWEFVTLNVVPLNPEIRVKLGLPRVLPSERKAKPKRDGIPRIGQGGWEGYYFRKVKK